MNDDNKNTLVFGASTKPDRYSYKAIVMLQEYGHSVAAIGGRKAELGEVSILTGHPVLEGIHTVTMYMSEARQKEHEAYILGLAPSRIIFNPGAENPPLFVKAKAAGIEAVNACTLVMLRTGQF